MKKEKLEPIVQKYKKKKKKKSQENAMDSYTPTKWTTYKNGQVSRNTCCGLCYAKSL